MPINIRPRTEALINFMYYRFNMDVDNPKVQERMDRMFGDSDWRNQAFLSLSGREREEAFLIYFCEKIDAKYKLPFRIMMDVEDQDRSQRNGLSTSETNAWPHTCHSSLSNGEA